MSINTKLMGTAGVLAAALVAGPAAANTLAGFTTMVGASYTHTSVTGNGSIPDSNEAALGGSIAMPIEEVTGINWQLDAQYAHHWGDCGDGGSCSAEIWNFGFSPFWAGESGRIGFNVNYLTATHFGHLTSGGGFAEWYFGPVTAHVKGGWISSGGTPIGGHGNYLGGAVTGYALPNLSITGAFNWGDLVTGQSCSVCGRSDINERLWSAIVEFLVSERIPISIWGSFTYGQHSVPSSVVGINDKFNSTTWMVGVRYYVGQATLIEQHRNGNLFGWLRGAASVGGALTGF